MRLQNTRTQNAKYLINSYKNSANKQKGDKTMNSTSQWAMGSQNTELRMHNKGRKYSQQEIFPQAM